MTVRDFERLFSPAIRTSVNWRAFRRERWPVRVEAVVGRDDLGKLVLPWYRDGQENGWVFAHGSRPITVAQAARRLHQLSPKTRLRVLKIAASLADEQDVPSVFLPAWRIPKGRLVLDGCHRAVALYLVAAEPRVMLAAVHGPSDPGAALDLEHHRAKR